MNCTIYMQIRGKLVLDKERAAAIEMQLTPQNLKKETISLAEIFEEFLDKEVILEIYSLTKRYTEDPSK
jgi:hypothetical protein